jgi:hypothetical protein
MTASHLQNALGMSKAQATSFVQAYYANEVVRFDRSEMDAYENLLLQRSQQRSQQMDAYDNMLLQRSQKIIGRTRTQNLLGADKQEVEAQERQTQLQSTMHSLEQKVSTRLQEMQKEMQEQMQEQHTKLLAALQPLMRTTLHTQGSTSAAYVRTGQPNAVHIPPVPPPNGYGITDGQGTRNEEPNPPPRRSIQEPVFVSGGDHQDVESVSVFPADFVFWR